MANSKAGTALRSERDTIMKAHERRYSRVPTAAHERGRASQVLQLKAQPKDSRRSHEPSEEERPNPPNNLLVCFAAVL
jgi:hypothetical protein